MYLNKTFTFTVSYRNKKLSEILLALKFGSKERKKIPTAVELLPANLGLLGFSYILIESKGGSGSKVNAGVVS